MRSYQLFQIDNHHINQQSNLCIKHHKFGGKRFSTYNPKLMKSTQSIVKSIYVIFQDSAKRDLLNVNALLKVFFYYHEVCKVVSYFLCCLKFGVENVEQNGELEVLQKYEGIFLLYYSNILSGYLFVGEK